MAYRNGTYVAFYAAGTNIPGGNSDIDYYRLMTAWDGNPKMDFTLVDSHEKTSAVRDSSSKETLRRRLLERLSKSKNMVLILGNRTIFDTDWVPFEIEAAVDNYKIPIIAAYTEVKTRIYNPAAFRNYWPLALANRIDYGTASVIHMPFNQKAILDATKQFGPNHLPNGRGLGVYDAATCRLFGILG